MIGASCIYCKYFAVVWYAYITAGANSLEKFFFENEFGYSLSSPIFALPKFLKTHAEVAQLVEHHLAKVRVAGSSLVFRSKNSKPFRFGIFFAYIYRMQKPWWWNW